MAKDTLDNSAKGKYQETIQAVCEKNHQQQTNTV